ncbi:MAG TPA: tetratricopeptide repeat protein [Bryobacteraceae bacterium]|jgi:Flp pilus assembly protein TadD|nr:tetratricopeptide repeat protein [Bryobacteraceae bacterium]
MSIRGRLSLALAFTPIPLAAQAVTFSKDIAPIIFSHCAPCHRPGEAAPFSLLAYSDVRKRGAQIVQVTGKRYMPPWMPEPGHGDFAGSLRLSNQQIDTLARWVGQGMPEGDPADLPPTPRFTEGWQLGTPDLIVHMSQVYHLTAIPGNVFRNFVMPVNLKETKYVRAFELRPSNKKVVHHANVIIDRSRLLRRRDGEDGQPGFSGMDVITEVTGEFDPDSHFLFWKPGSPAQQEPVHMPWKLDPGSDLIVNLHLQPSGKPEIVDAEVGLYFTNEPPALHPMLLQLEHDGAIDIPPGSSTFAVTDHLKLPVAVSLLAVYPHAHFLGKQVDAWAELPDGKRLSLLKIVHWDINWQASYTYRQPISLPAGTTVAMRIAYDNTAENPRNPNHPPKRVRAGNRSEDEMGHVWLQVLSLVPNNDEDPRLVLQQALMRRRIEKYPADFVAHFNLGAVMQQLGRPEQALPYLTEAVRIQPSSVTARNNLAVALFAMERFEDAAKEFRQALLLDPGYRNARYNLARTLSAEGDNANALTELRVYLETNQDDASAHELAGRLLALAGKLEEALPHFRRATELEPDNADLLTNLGAALASAGDLAGAVPVFERALKVDPSNAVARDNLARARRSLEGKP